MTRASARSPTSRNEQPPEHTAYADAAATVATGLRSDELHGLSDDEAARRLAAVGPNLWRRAERPPYVRIAARQLVDPLVGLLLAAAVVSLAIGETLEAGVIASIVVLNGALGFVQEAGAERALLALSRAIEVTASVVRSGRERTIPADELVPGDLVVLREGDRVPADARIVRAERLAVDESALTGESMAVEKAAEAVPRGTMLADRASMVHAGTGVTRGRGRALVTATGETTELGLIAGLASGAKPPRTPLQRRLGRLSKAMIVLGVAVMVVLTAGMLLQGESLHDAFLVGVSVAVAAVPEGLAATVTIALAQGARAMATRGAIVRRLPAVETLGSASLIATDKTGTLTVNQLRVVAVEPWNGWSADDVLATGVLASTAELVEEDGILRVAGDNVDGAFLLAAREHGLQSPACRRLLEVPFDPQRKRLTVVYDIGGVDRLLAVKGAPEIVLERTQLGEDDRAQVGALAEDWARHGLRVLAVAERRLPGAEPVDEESDRDLRLVGLAALQDPLRPAAADAVQSARIAGIGVSMLTGDHPLTAATIGEQVGLGDGVPLTGSQLEQLDEAGLEDAVTGHSVFARVTPADKLRLVEAYQRGGAVVAVTGDGINDTPALRRADVGVAMGRSGTEAAREAADIVLTDDDFATIVAAIEEGRRIGDNVRKFVAFLLSANLGEIVLFGIAVLAGLGVPMTVVQVLTVNLVTDGLPAIALARDPASRGSMRRGPHSPGRLFDRAVLVGLGLAGVAIGLAATAAYVAGRELEPDAAQTMAFATVAIAELVFVFSTRSPLAPSWRGPRNDALLGGVLLSVGVVASTIYVGPLQGAFGTVPLGLRELLLVLGLAVLPTALVELAKALRR